MPAAATAKKMKVLEALKRAETYLAKHGIESARLNAEHLLARRMGCTRLDLYLRFDREASEDVVAGYREDLKKRATRYPLQYLLGEVEFLSLPFKVREGVFIPRPETELLVEWIEEIAGAAPALEFVELGVGTGVIAGSLGRRHPGWRGRAIDVSPAAVALARENFAALGIDGRVELSVASGLEAIEPGGAFDLVVANPPYVPTGEIPALEAEVSRHESRAALDGGEQGLDFYPALAREAMRLLKPGGFVAFEIGAGQGAAALDICARAGLERATMRKDYGGFERMVTAFAPDGGRASRG